MAVYFEGQRKTTALIDCDNTVYPGSDRIWEGIRLALLASLGHHVDADSDEYKRFVASGDQVGWSTTYVNWGGERDKFDEIAANAPKAPYVEHNPLLEDVIGELARHVDRIIVFSGSFTQPVIEALDVIIGSARLLISDVMGADRLDGRPSKPSPKAYQYMMQVYGIKPEETIFFDDHVEELKVANSFGISSVLVGPRHRDSLPEGFQAIFALEDMFEVLEING